MVVEIAVFLQQRTVRVNRGMESTMHARRFSVFWILALLGVLAFPLEEMARRSLPFRQVAIPLSSDMQGEHGQFPESLETRTAGVIGNGRVEDLKESIGQEATTHSAKREINEAYTISYQAGQYDVNGNFMGGTEVMKLVPSGGKLYAAIGYWEDVRGRDPLTGPQILVLDSPQGRWRVEHSFSEKLPNGRQKFVRVTELTKVTFTTDGKGRPLSPAVSMLIAGLDGIGRGAIGSRNDVTGEWIEMNPEIRELKSVRSWSFRSFALYKDPVTGIDKLYAGGGSSENGSQRGAIISGVYDPSAPGRIKWDKTPEFTGFKNRVMAFAECDRRLYFAAKPALYERTSNGSRPKWEMVYSYPQPIHPNNSGLRSLTVVQNPRGPGQVILAGMEGSGLLIRIDPTNNHSVTTELDVPRFLRERWRLPSYKDYVTPGYSGMPFIKDAVTGSYFLIIGLEAHCPLPGKQHSAWYLVRDFGGRYSLHEVPPLRLASGSSQTPSKYLSMNGSPATDMRPNLVSVRTIAISPFPEGASHTLYLGGYDGENRPAHNTAWIYRATLQSAILEGP
jgi:hypothetical protein